ncbi:MAG: Hsp33 family molecular chaperone HslO [Clostridia bacterium]
MSILKKYLTNNDQVVVYLIEATDMVSKVRDMHSLSNVATAALGRSMMATTMLAAMLKEKGQRITTSIKGDGPIGSIVVCANKELDVKGYVANPCVELPLNSVGKLDVAAAVGKGKLNIIKDIGMKEPFCGSCELFTSEIAEDYAYYFYTSEQTPSVVSLGVLIDEHNTVIKAGGYIIQPLPGCDEDTIIKIEEINKQIQSVTYLMLDLEDLNDVVKTITVDNNAREIDSKVPNLNCDCSKERIDKVIVALGKKEAIEHVKEHDGIEVSCHFCNKVYKYNEQEVEKLFK